MANLSARTVCLSVRYVPVPDENGLKYSHGFFHHTVAQSFCFISIKHLHEIPTGSPPCGGAKCRWGTKISRVSTNKSIYIANDARYRHSYCGRRIGTRMRSIKWCHFQWSWTNPNLDFKVTPLFDAKYGYGYGYDHSYYRRRIGNCPQAFEWHQRQFHFQIFNPEVV